jgi:hypothetical protein
MLCAIQYEENVQCTLLILATLFSPFGFIALKTLNYLAFQFFDFERTP